MELRERIAREIIPHLHWTYSKWDGSDDATRYEALEIADNVIAELGLRREVELVEPRATSWTRFVPYLVERHVTLWERVDDS